MPSIMLGGYIPNGWLSVVNMVCLRRLCRGGGVTNLRGPFPINWRCEVKGVVDIENP